MCAAPIVCLCVCVCVFSPPFRHTSFKYFSLFLSLSLVLASLLERFSTGIGKNILNFRWVLGCARFAEFCGNSSAP